MINFSEEALKLHKSASRGNYDEVLKGILKGEKCITDYREDILKSVCEESETILAKMDVNGARDLENLMLINILLLKFLVANEDMIEISKRISRYIPKYFRIGNIVEREFFIRLVDFIYNHLENHDSITEEDMIKMVEKSLKETDNFFQYEEVDEDFIEEKMREAAKKMFLELSNQLLESQNENNFCSKNENPKDSKQSQENEFEDLVPESVFLFREFKETIREGKSFFKYFFNFQ